MQADSKDRGMQYILNVMDAFSRYTIGLKALRTKTALAVLRAFQALATQAGVSPDVTLSDNGGEFQGVWDWCRARDISVIKTHSHSPTENPVERSNKQLRALLSRLFTVRGNKRWVDALPDITETLRNTYNGNLKAHRLQFVGATAGSAY
eukprot:gene23047-17438_t